MGLNSSTKTAVNQGRTSRMRLNFFARPGGFSALQLRALRDLFYAEGYRLEAGLDASLDPETIFAHYLEFGLPKDVSPGPFFDVEFCRSRMGSPAGSVVS